MALTALSLKHLFQNCTKLFFEIYYLLIIPFLYYIVNQKDKMKLISFPAFYLILEEINYTILELRDHIYQN